MTSFYVDCACFHMDHQVRVALDLDDDHGPALYITPRLIRPRSLRRLRTAARYLFGIRPSAFGGYEEVLVKPSDARRIADLCLRFADAAERSEP